MNCPICRETQLVMTHRENIEIDYCPQCRGVWLDRGELDKIIERSAAQNHVWAQPESTQAAPAAMQTPMPQAPMPQDQHRSSSREEPRRDDGYSRRDRDDDDDDNRYRGKKKRGGFLGDLFDFD